MDLTNSATKKELNDVTGVDASNLAAKRDFNVLKTEVDKLDINKFFNNLKTKVDNLDVNTSKTARVDLTN